MLLMQYLAALAIMVLGCNFVANLVGWGGLFRETLKWSLWLITHSTLRPLAWVTHQLAEWLEARRRTSWLGIGLGWLADWGEKAAIELPPAAVKLLPKKS